MGEGWILMIFLWQAMFPIFRIWTKYYPYLKHFQGIYSLLVTITKPLCNKIREAFGEGLKWKCKLFEMNEQEDFKNLSFSGNPLNI